jgi:hypothetical protein
MDDNGGSLASRLSKPPSGGLTAAVRGAVAIADEAYVGADGVVIGAEGLDR